MNRLACRAPAIPRQPSVVADRLTRALHGAKARHIVSPPYAFSGRLPDNMRERVAARGDASRDPTPSISRATSATTATAAATTMANDDGNDNGNGDGGGDGSDGGNKGRFAVMIFPLPSRCHRMFR